MKILYAIQGTGNGHITCARDIIPRLKKKADVDILISGCQADVDLPYKIDYRLNGLSFIFGKRGGIDYVETYKRSKLKKLFNDIKQLPVQNYDLVISDFEPISAWACYLKNIPCIGLSHQAAVINKSSPKPSKSDVLGQAVLRYYAPVKYCYGFHYLPYDKNIFTPIIRKEVRDLTVSNQGHYTVYLPAFGDKQIIKLLSCFPHTQWQVFSKHTKKEYEKDHVSIRPIQNNDFIKSIAGSEGVLCGAGFQTPAEVLFLQKKLLVIPMKGQYEQQCNAAALKMLGIPVVKNLKKKRYKEVEQWIKSDQHIDMNFPDIADEVVRLILSKHHLKREELSGKKTVERYPQFRNLVLKKIFYQPQVK